MSSLPDDACTFWQRQLFREASDDGFGCSPFSVMTPEECAELEARRDREDEGDPMCGRCTACLEFKSDAHEGMFAESEEDRCPGSG